MTYPSYTPLLQTLGLDSMVVVVDGLWLCLRRLSDVDEEEERLEREEVSGLIVPDTINLPAKTWDLVTRGVNSDGLCGLLRYLQLLLVT